MNVVLELNERIFEYEKEGYPSNRPYA